MSEKTVENKLGVFAFTEMVLMRAKDVFWQLFPLLALMFAVDLSLLVLLPKMKTWFAGHFMEVGLSYFGFYILIHMFLSATLLISIDRRIHGQTLEGKWQLALKRTPYLFTFFVLLGVVFFALFSLAHWGLHIDEQGMQMMMHTHTHHVGWVLLLMLLLGVFFIRLFVMVPELLLGGASLLESIRNGFSYTHGNTWNILARAVVVLMVVALGAFIWSTVVGLLLGSPASSKWAEAMVIFYKVFINGFIFHVFSVSLWRELKDQTR